MEEESHYGLGLRHLEGSAVARALGDRERAPLGRLTLFGCGLSSLRGLPTYGSRCEALRVLVLSSNELGGAFDAALYPALGELEQLETLDVSSNRLRDLEPPRNARPLLRLRSFTVVYNQLASLRGLADWAPNLETLDARANTLSDVRGASALRRLRRLSLRGAATDDGNPLCAHKRYRQRVVEEAPSVVELDGEALEDALRASVLPLPRKRADEEDIADEVEERPPQRRRDGRQQTRATDNNEARRVDALEAELEALRVELAEVTEGRDEEAAEERSRLESERDVALSVASAAHAACKDRAVAILFYVLRRVAGPSSVEAWFETWRRACDVERHAEDAARRTAAEAQRLDDAREDVRRTLTADHDARLDRARGDGDAALQSAERSRAKVVELRQRLAASHDRARVLEARGAEAAAENAAAATALRTTTAAAQSATAAEAARLRDATSASHAALAAHADEAGRLASRVVMEQAAKVAALAANDSARQQLTDLRAAFARAAAASADGRAAALAAAARESGMAASLAELSDLAASQKAELTRLRAARDAAKVRANAAVDELRACAAEAAQAQTRALGRDAKTLELEKHLTLLDAHLTTARADALQTSARLAANDADAARRADARNAADAAAAAAVADARRYAKLAGAAADAAESAQVELARRDRRISDLESQHDDVHRLAQLETERATADTNAARDVLQEENALLRDDVDRSETRLKAQFEIERRLRSVVAELRSQGTAAAESGALERRRPPADQAPAADARRHALADKEQELRYVEGELLGLSRHYEKKYDVASAHLEADNARLKASLSALSQKHESAADQLRLAANAAGEAARSHESLRGQVDALTRQRDALAKRLAKLEADAKADICPY